MSDPIDPDVENIIERYIRNRVCKGFNIVPRYSHAGDFIEVYFEDEASYIKQLTPCISLELSMKDHRIVGVKIYGVKELLGAKDSM